MIVNITLCNSDNYDDEFILKLSDSKFIELWQDYLSLPFDRLLYSPKDIINSIDEKLDPNYNIQSDNSSLLNIIKKLEDICIMGLINQDTICLKVEK